MSIENFTSDHSWVTRPMRVSIEYVDGSTFSKVMPAIEAKSLNDRQWVDERLGGLSIRTMLIESIDSLDSDS